jgi:hypothetical protein
MKKNLLVIALLPFFLTPALARNTVESLPESRFSNPEPLLLESDTLLSDPNETAPPKSTIIFNGSVHDFIFAWRKKAQESHWPGLGFAFSNLKGLEQGRLNLSRSYSIVLNLDDYIIPFNNNWLLATGLGFDWSRYHFRGNWSLQADDDRTSFLPDPDRSYRDSKLLIYYATIPLLLEYQTKLSGHKTFFVYGGLEGLIKLYSKSQVEVKTPNGIRKETYKGLNLIPLNFRFTARIGFNDFGLFGYYQPISMFEKGLGPDIQPYGMGVVMNF